MKEWIYSLLFLYTVSLYIFIVKINEYWQKDTEHFAVTHLGYCAFFVTVCCFYSNLSIEYSFYKWKSNHS